LTRSLLLELREVVEDLSTRADIGCLVLLSAKEESFCHGAHIDLFDDLDDVQQASAGARAGQELMNAWEALPFPTIAAIHSTCMGGGTELSLASTYRLMSDSSRGRIGLPEVKLGILPAWGGCVRLPRVIGLEEALGLILPGKSLAPKAALKLGLVDAVLPETGFRHHVRDFALGALREPARRRSGRDLRELLLEKNPFGRRMVFEQARKRSQQGIRARYPAPARAIEVIRIGSEQGAEAGFEAEARAFGELATGSVSKNLIHVFRLTQAAKKDQKQGRSVERHEADGPEAQRPSPETSVVATGAVAGIGIVGSGLMGTGIAQLAALKTSSPVRLLDIVPEPATLAVGRIAQQVGNRIKRRRLSASMGRKLLARLQPTSRLRGFYRTAVVLETVPEDLETKREVLQRLAQSTSEGTLLASSTSSLSIDALAEGNEAAARILGLHFFNPVHQIPLVEVVAGSHTAPETLATAVTFVRSLEKIPLRVADRPGFLVNRLLGFYMVEALWLLAEEVAPEQIDAVMVDWGFPVGPFALIDRVGIDVALAVAGQLSKSFPERLVLPAWNWGEAFLQPRKLGVKSGAGFYRYEGGKPRSIDTEACHRLGLGPAKKETRALTIADRLILPMVNEAARCLEEGVVEGPGQIDLATILGASFPAFRGGLCWWADSQDLGSLVNVLERLESSVAPRFAPSRALREAATVGAFHR